MPGCPYFLANTFLHIFSGIVLTGLSAENPVLGDLSKKPLTHLLFFLFTFGLVLIVSGLPVGSVKYLLFGLLCFALGQNVSGLEQRLKQKGLLTSVLLYTGVVFGTVMTIALLDPQNMLSWQFYLTTALLALVCALVFSALFIEDPSTKNTISQWLARFTVVLFTLFIGFDVQVLKENAKLCAGNPDYVGESLALYLDVLNLFTGIGES